MGFKQLGLIRVILRRERNHPGIQARVDYIEVENSAWVETIYDSMSSSRLKWSEFGSCLSYIPYKALQDLQNDVI
jgi:hypothetical protein